MSYFLGKGSRPGSFDCPVNCSQPVPFPPFPAQALQSPWSQSAPRYLSPEVLILPRSWAPAHPSRPPPRPPPAGSPDSSLPQHLLILPHVSDCVCVCMHVCVCAHLCVCYRPGPPTNGGLCIPPGLSIPPAAQGWSSDDSEEGPTCSSHSSTLSFRINRKAFQRMLSLQIANL